MIGLWHQEHVSAAHFLGKWSILLSPSLSWGLHCMLSFTIIASQSDNSGVPCRASICATYWLGSVAFCIIIVKFCNIYILASFIPRKSASHGWCLVSLPARDLDWTSWITTPVASACLHDWGLENTSLESHADVQCYEGFLCSCILSSNDSFSNEFEFYTFALSLNRCSHIFLVVFLLNKTWSLKTICHYRMDNNESLYFVVSPNVGKSYAILLSRFS